MAIVSIKSQYKGPAPLLSPTNADMDIIDEALSYFKANVFFRSYEVKVLNVLWYIKYCLYLLTVLNFFLEWSRSCIDLHYFIHNWMFKKASEMSE